MTRIWERFKQEYKDQSWRRRHPATSFLVETVLIVAIMWLSFYVPEWLAVSPDLSHITRADYNIKQLGEVEQMLENLRRWRYYYFVSPRDDTETGGESSFRKLAYIVPTLVLITSFLTPILLAGYTIWFLYNYIWDLFSVVWGLVLYLGYYFYKYIIYLVGQISVLGTRIGKLLPMDTSAPVFGNIISRWRQAYIDPIILRERIAYLEAIQSFIEKNVEPYYNQAISPAARLKAEWQFLWHTFVVRTGRVLEETVGAWGDNTQRVVEDGEQELKRRWKNLPKSVKERARKVKREGISGRIAEKVKRVGKKQWSLPRLVVLSVSLLSYILTIVQLITRRRLFKRLPAYVPPLVTVVTYPLNYAL